MSEPQELSVLIDKIYDAAVNPSLWMDVVKQTTQFLEGFAGIIVMGYPNGVDKEIMYSSGCDHRHERLYNRKYRRDLWPPLSPYFKVGEIFNTAEAPQTALNESSLYQKLLEPQHVGDNFICVLERSSDSYAAFSLLRHESGCERDTTLRRMRLIMPHLRRALLIEEAIKFRNSETSTFMDVLDGLRAGVFLLDAKQRLVHANESGRAMLTEGILFKTASGKLTAGEPEGARILENGIAMAASEDGVDETRDTAMLLRTQGNGQHIAYLLPIASEARRRAGAAVAALFVHRGEGEISSSSEIIAKHYKLTPTERRVLHAIAEADGVPEVADMLGVARSTIKTHLHRVFTKTQTQRQGDLIKLLAAFSNPLTR